MKVPCKHWSYLVPGVGSCACKDMQARYGERPSAGVCMMHCPKGPHITLAEYQKAQGFAIGVDKKVVYDPKKPGDLMAITLQKITGIPPCSSCNQMRAWMNEIGWSGCVRNHRQIRSHLQKMANQHGFQLDKKVWFPFLLGLKRGADDKTDGGV